MIRVELKGIGCFRGARRIYNHTADHSSAFTLIELLVVVAIIASGSRISRGAAQSFIFVSRLNEESWYPVNSTEGEKIMTEWQAPGPDGKTPVVSVP